MYDETTNKGNSKELQLQIRFWSEAEGAVVTRHMETFFIGHATASDLKQKLDKAIDNLGVSRHKLLTLGSDGPNVNKKVYKLLNEDIKLLRNNKTGLIDIGTCNIHIIHNSFLKGLNEFGINVSDFAVSIKYFFKDKASRWEDYEVIQKKLKLPRHTFIKHVTARWLTLGDAASRLIEQWPGIIEYFLKYIPKHCPQIAATETYKTIKSFLDKPMFKYEILFVESSSKIFSRFLKTFQKEEPLIHILYSELENLITTIMLRFVKGDVIVKFTSIDPNTFFKDVEHLLDTRDIDIGSVVRSKFLEDKVSEKEEMMFKFSARKHYIAVCTHIIVKSSMCNNSLIKYLQCLQPGMISQPKSVKFIMKVAEALPHDCNLDKVCEEWKLLQIDKSVDLQALSNTFTRIDHFWHNIFCLKTESNDFKYPNLATVIKQALVFSHGNASVERGFSDSGKIMSLDRNKLSERTLNAILTVKSGLQRYHNKVQLLEIDNKLIQLARLAHQKYKIYQEEKKKQEEDDMKKEKEMLAKRRVEQERLEKLQQEKTTIEETEKSLLEKEKYFTIKVLGCNKLLAETNGKLKRALQKNDLGEISMCQMMLESINKTVETVEEEKKEYIVHKRRLEKRKAAILESAVSKKIAKVNEA